MTAPDWQDDGWWRVLKANGGLWMETSDEDEAREALTDITNGTLQRHQKAVQQRWVTA